MRACVLAVFLTLLAAAPACALDACFTQSVGPWRGPVWNGPGLEIMDTDFQVAPDGTLVGQYHVYDNEPFDGSLTAFHQTGPCEADFTWTDRYGAGTVHIRFEPDIGRFIGDWGLQGTSPTLEFDGYRKRPPAIS
jgi:hypothetical protein